MSGKPPAALVRAVRPADAAPDAELLARFAAGRDGAAFAELVRRHGPLVFGVCRRAAGHAEDAEDAFQAVFLILARKAGIVRRPEVLGNYLYGVAVRVARKARRRAARRREVQVPTFPDPPAPMANTTDDLGPAVDEELARLPDYYRAAVLLCDVQGASRSEAAARLGVPEGTISSRLAAGRKKLAARLAARGLAPVLVLAAGVPADLAARAAAGAAGRNVLELAREGWPMGLKLGAVLATAGAVAVGWAGLSGRAEPPKPTDPPKPTVEAKAADGPAAEKKGEVRFTTRPKLTDAVDLPFVRFQSAAWSPDGSKLAVMGFFNNGSKQTSVLPYNGSGRHTDHDFGLKHKLVGYTPDGKRLAVELREPDVISGFHRLELTDPDAGYKVVEKVPFEGDEQSYYFMPNGKAVRTVRAVGRAASGWELIREIEVRDIALGSGAQTERLRLEGEFYASALSADGKRLAAIIRAKDGTDAGLEVWDVDAAKRLWSLPGEWRKLDTGWLRPQLGMSPDGKYVLFANKGPGLSFSLYDGATGKRLPPLDVELNLARVSDWSFSHDGRLLALNWSSQNKRPAPNEYVQVWDLGTRTLLKTWPGTARLAFSPTAPVLAMFETRQKPSGFGGGSEPLPIRVGFWDFAAPK